MGGKDIEITTKLKELLQSGFAGLKLKAYFENMPEKKIRRAIALLATVYPERTVLSDDDFVFIPYMLSNEKFLEQKSFFGFIQSLNSVNFTESQKNILIGVIKDHFETLCEICTCELDILLVRIFSRSDLFAYMEMMARDKGGAVLQHLSDILRHEDFSDAGVPDEALEKLKQSITRKLHA